LAASVAVEAAGAAARSFAAPEEAVQALVSALRSHDQSGLRSIFGPASGALVSSGDPVGDRLRREAFLRDYDREHRLVTEKGRVILVVGERQWPFPIPLAAKGGRWSFDTAAGKEEILNRRIGENELSTIKTLLAIVDAQREYAMEDRDHDGMREYARRFASAPGKRDGLYWPTAPGEAPSPLGGMVAAARAEGYRRDQASRGPAPYHGYLFRLLERQGKHAPGGAFEYVVRNRMLGGFAVVAYPAVYGSSGVMTFMVNHEGVVYEKDLGPKTAQAAAAMNAFDPDGSWRKAD
jgi:hypothetical protein